MHFESEVAKVLLYSSGDPHFKVAIDFCSLDHTCHIYYNEQRSPLELDFYVSIQQHSMEH